MENMEQKQICPWCDTEIVWDEEIGPEDACPHCFNELQDYRSIEVQLDRDGDAEQLPTEEDASAYREAIEDVRIRQHHAPECGQCGELMVEAGKQTVEAGQFEPAAVVNGRALLQAPFVLDMYVCPECFETRSILSPDSRQAWTEAASRS